MKRLVLILIAIAAVSLSLTSCVTKKKCDEKFPPQIVYKDSIIESIVFKYKDTTVHDTIPGDSVIVLVKIDCEGGKVKDQKRKQIFENTFLKVDLAVINSKPFIWVIRKVQFRDYFFQKIYAEKLSKHFKNSTKIIVVTEYKTPIWNWIFIGFLIAVIIYLIIRN